MNISATGNESDITTLNQDSKGHGRNFSTDSYNCQVI